MIATSRDPLNVLVVDDDPHLLRTLSDILRRSGYLPRTAARGREGLSVADNGGPLAIALIDLKLPDMDGMEVVSRLREKSQATEIVVLTGNASIESAVGAMRQHTCDYLIKPVAPDQLMNALGRAGERWLRRRAEDALREGEERFRWLIEGIGDVVLLTDPDFRVKYASPSVARVLGHELDAVLGRSVLEFFDAPQDSSETVAVCMQRALTGIPVEVVGKHRDGIRVLQVSVNDLRDNPSLRGLVLTVRDITRLRKFEQQAMQAHRLDSVGRLAGGLAHDFNNILSVVLGSTELAADEPGLPPAVRTHLEAVRMAGEKAANLTRQLLQFARRQSGEPRTLDLRELVQTMMPLLRRLIPENVEIVLDWGTGAMPLVADPTQIEQVLVNLTINARDAMPNGGTLTISLKKVELGEELMQRHARLVPGKYVVLSVTDTGTGMSEEVRSRALEPFFTTKEPGSGTGLGLSICYGIVSHARGSLALTSAPGKGTRVELVMPLADALPGQQASPVSTQLPRGKETILVAEDDEAIRRLVAVMLERLGYRVVTVPNGEEALRLALGDAHFDMLLCDVVMPAKSGVEVAAELARSRPNMRVLLMSGYPNLVRGSSSALPAPLIYKPFTSSDLARKVRAVLDAGATEATAG
jgi:two-component system, cell cycle sensor histidine kinase and response regulator CckA